MYGSQEKILGQKVNVKFFTLDPYSVGTGVPQTFLEWGKIQNNFFLTIKTSMWATNFISQFSPPIQIGLGFTRYDFQVKRINIYRSIMSHPPLSLQ